MFNTWDSLSENLIIWKLVKRKLFFKICFLRKSFCAISTRWPKEITRQRLFHSKKKTKKCKKIFCFSSNDSHSDYRKKKNIFRVFVSHFLLSFAGTFLCGSANSKCAEVNVAQLIFIVLVQSHLSYSNISPLFALWGEQQEKIFDSVESVSSCYCVECNDKTWNFPAFPNRRHFFSKTNFFNHS